MSWKGTASNPGTYAFSKRVLAPRLLRWLALSAPVCWPGFAGSWSSPAPHA